MSGGAVNAAAAVKTAYQGVIDDVIKGVRELFLNEGVDEQVLSDLKELWENKLEESGVINHPPPLIPRHKVQTETPPKHGQQVWNVRQQQQHQQHQSHSSPVIHHQQPRQQQQQQQHKRPQQQSPVTVSGSHEPQPVFTSVSNASQPLTNPVTSADTAASSSSTTQSTPLLQSSIANTAAIANMIPNLQYMIPGVTGGQSNPGYTVVLDPQSGTPIMIPMATLASVQMAKQLQALQQQTAAAVARGNPTTSSSSAAQQFSVIQNPALSMLAAAAAATSTDTSSSKSQSSQSTDSSQVDGTLPPLSDNLSSEDGCTSKDTLHDSFLRFQSKQLQSNTDSFTPDILNPKETFDNPIKGSVHSKCKRIKAKRGAGIIPQLDGPNEESSEEEESEDSEDEDEAGQGATAGDDDPLNSDDDDSLKSDEEDKFETENIIVCQFDKVTRTRIGGKNRWKFHLKDGIMNLDGCDYVFQKATGEADW